MNEKHDIKQVFDQNLSSLRFQAESRQAVIDRALRKEEPVMKKKMSVALVFTITLVLVAVTALATIVVIRSDNVNKLNLSREALYEKYNLTPQTLGLFLYERLEENGAFTLTWTCDTFHPALTGIYTTVVKDGNAEASWSYDDVDTSVYDSGAFSASVWGYKQLEASFKDKETASEYSLALYAQSSEKTEYVPPRLLGEGEAYWRDGEVIRAAEPGINDLTRNQAYEIAIRAFAEDFNKFEIDVESIAASLTLDESFHVRDNGQTLWMFWAYLIHDGVEYECGITLDGTTGEVLSIDVLTGGNG